MTELYPFSAIVGQEQLKQALVLNAVNPVIGGVLVRGEKGTAKSTLARALAELLPEIPVVDGCPFRCDPAAPFKDCPYCLSAEGPKAVMQRMRVVTLPANATEDRVAGSLDVEQALKNGQRRFEPGVLADAHRGILYIDEVNLLDDHIIDLLLDAAAMGVNSIEREGLSFRHPARFVLVGTMNPEEGDVRPQLLDRFGLCVDVDALMDVGARAEIVRRRIAWEKDPAIFADGFVDEQQQLALAIGAAQRLLPRAAVDDEQLELAAQTCVQLDVRSHRADIVMIRTALTIAAFAGRTCVHDDDVKQAAFLALPHRMRRRPFEESRLDPDVIEQVLRSRSDSKQASAVPDDSPATSSSSGEPPGQVVEADETAASMLVLPETPPGAAVDSGRCSRAQTDAVRGRYTRAEVPQGPYSAGDIAVDATLRAAAPYQSATDEMLCVQPDHIRIKRRRRSAGTTVLFVVDASGSMVAAARMAAAKGAALSLLRDAYVKRNRVALIAFRDNGAEILLQPTDNVDLAHAQLQELPTGGRTPLAHGLAGALELAHQVQQRDADHHLMTVLISDGKANVAYAAKPEPQVTPFDEAVAVARQLVLRHSSLLVLDVEDDFLCLGLARKLAESASADYLKLSQIEADAVEGAVRAQLA
ncbi:MAG: magnesium chelatase subunit D family protein [Deltaproteobacteria bacterium]|nr:magnesium chelatase subunit D family protein [Deltaproteobacteria bacterium]